MIEKYYQPLQMSGPDWQFIKNYIMVNYVLNQETLVASYHINSITERQMLKSMVQRTLVKHNFGDCDVKSAILFMVPPESKVNIHIDGYTAERKDASNYAMNIPIENCEQGVMHWYSGDYTLEEKMTSENLRHLKIKWNGDPEVLCSKIIDVPCIVKVDTPHNVENLGNKHRLILSIRFRPDLAIQ
jgi:hypothetical protein